LPPLSGCEGAFERLSDECGAEGPLVITRNGKPAAVLLFPTMNDDLERLLLGRSPRFKRCSTAPGKASRKGKAYPRRLSGGVRKASPRAKGGSCERPPNQALSGPGLARFVFKRAYVKGQTSLGDQPGRMGGKRLKLPCNRPKVLAFSAENSAAIDWCSQAVGCRISSNTRLDGRGDVDGKKEMDRSGIPIRPKRILKQIPSRASDRGFACRR